MSWSTRQSGNRMIGAAIGRIDENSWERFLADLNQAIGDAAAAGFAFVLDLSEIEYMSSRGLRVLTLARREADAKSVSFSLARPNDRMREILSISRYDKIFKIEESLD